MARLGDTEVRRDDQFNSRNGSDPDYEPLHLSPAIDVFSTPLPIHATSFRRPMPRDIRRRWKDCQTVLLIMSTRFSLGPGVQRGSRYSNKLTQSIRLMFI